MTTSQLVPNATITYTYFQIELPEKNETDEICMGQRVHMTPKDVFISHSSRDKDVAFAACAKLEAAGIRCWIAPRDVSPGTDWAVAIVDGIYQCKAFVLIFTGNSNISGHVQREVRLAVADSMPFVTMRFEDVALSKPMSFFLGTQQWLDAHIQPSQTVAERDHVSLPPPLTSAVSSIAVQPFRNLSADPEHQFVVDGLAMELRNTLAKIHRLRVIARSSSFDESGATTNIKKIVGDLNVQFVLSGSVQFANDRIRVTVALDNAVGEQIWSEIYNRDMSDLFSVQEEIAKSVTSQFGGIRLRDEIASALGHPTENLDAWSLVQRARAFVLGFTPHALKEAESLLRRAIDLDAEYAAAHAALASVLGEWVLNGFSTDMKKDRKEALESANRAFAHSPVDPFVLKMCGSVWAFFGKFDKSLSALRRAVKIAPFNFGAWGYFGWPLAESGLDNDFEELHRIMERILKATPNHPGVGYWLYHRSVAFTCQHHHKLAVDFAKRSIDNNPMFPWGWMHYANTLGLVGSEEQAREAMKRCMEISSPLTPEHYELMVRGMSANEKVAEARLAGLRNAKILA